MFSGITSVIFTNAFLSRKNAKIRDCCQIWLQCPKSCVQLSGCIFYKKRTQNQPSLQCRIQNPCYIYTVRVKIKRSWVRYNSEPIPCSLTSPIFWRHIRQKLLKSPQTSPNHIGTQPVNICSQHTKLYITPQRTANFRAVKYAPPSDQTARRAARYSKKDLKKWLVRLHWNCGGEKGFEKRRKRWKAQKSDMNLCSSPSGERCGCRQSGTGFSVSCRR